MRTSAAQLSLDFVAYCPRQVETPAARRSDPRSFHLAAEQITASGARGQRELDVRLLNRWIKRFQRHARIRDDQDARLIAPFVNSLF